MTPQDLSPLPALDGVEHRWLPRSWGSQHVVLAGPPSGAVVLLVHGWPEHWFAWRHVIPALAMTHRVVAVDTRGMGWSSMNRIEGDPTIVAIADDLVQVLDDLGTTEPVAIAGHDWGGIYAFRAAVSQPQRFARVIGVNTVPPWLDAAALLRYFLSWSYIFGMATVGRQVAASERAVRWLLSQSSTDQAWLGTPEAPSSAFASYVDALGHRGVPAMSRRVYAQLLRSLPVWSRQRRPPRLTAPATIIVGEDERITRRELYEWRCHPGEIDIVTVPGASHWVLDETPQRAVAAIRDALAGY